MSCAVERKIRRSFRDEEFVCCLIKKEKRRNVSFANKIRKMSCAQTNKHENHYLTGDNYFLSTINSSKNFESLSQKKKSEVSSKTQGTSIFLVQM